MAGSGSCDRNAQVARRKALADQATALDSYVGIIVASFVTFFTRNDISVDIVGSSDKLHHLACQHDLRKINIPNTALTRTNNKLHWYVVVHVPDLIYAIINIKSYPSTRNYQLFISIKSV